MPAEKARAENRNNFEDDFLAGARQLEEMYKIKTTNRTNYIIYTTTLVTLPLPTSVVTPWHLQQQWDGCVSSTHKPALGGGI